MLQNCFNFYSYEVLYVPKIGTDVNILIISVQKNTKKRRVLVVFFISWESKHVAIQNSIYLN